MQMTLPEGEFVTEWLDPKTGNSVQRSRVTQTAGTARLPLPHFQEDIVLTLRKS
jgi:hypothetical protein